MALKRRQSDLMVEDWMWDSDAGGRWEFETIRTAGIAESARRLISIDHTLKAILSRLDALGNDGIHELIRREVSRQRRSDRMRRAKAAAKRKKGAA